MASKTFGGWKGIDVRKLPTASPMNTVRKALNVDLTVEGGFHSRDPWTLFATVDPNSCGLYALGGQLRCAIPGGHSLVPPPGVEYDAIGAGGTAYALGSVTAVTAAETVGNSVATGLLPYLVVQRSSGAYEHHYIQKPTYPDSSVPNTLVTIPFKAGPYMIKMVEKLWALDAYNNGVRYSSVTNGPTDWTFANDAGELPTADQALGNRQITALGQIEGQLIVFFSDCVQAWNVYADPTNPNFGIQKVVYGPGTLAPHSVSNVRGDLFYFSSGAFRRLQKNLLTGQFREGDLGKEIRPITQGLDVTALPTFGLWSQWRQQYVCIIGNTAYCYLDSTLDGETNQGWTMWTTPAGTLQGMVEIVNAQAGQSILYARFGNSIYSMVTGASPTLEAGYSYDIRTQLYNGGDAHVMKDWEFIEVQQLGNSTLNFYDDGNNPDVAINTGLSLSGPTTENSGYTPVMATSRHLGFGLTGTSQLQFEELTIYSTPLGV